jgi:glycosyltransferase involved in cell wall biosynthesis
MLDTEHSTYELKTNPRVVHQSAPSIFYDKTFKRDNNIDTTLDTIDEDFCFLNVGVFNQRLDRKNIRQTIQSFQQTFKRTNSNGMRKVALVLKINGPKYNTTDFIDIKQYISETNKEFKNPCSVYLLYGNYTSKQLKSLYTHPKIKCYISLSHGEGYGRPVLESTLSELPVILTNWSGHTEFIPNNSDLLVSGTLTEVNDNFPNKTDKSMWFSADMNSAMTCIDRVYENYDEYKTLAINLSTKNIRKYNKDNMFEKYTQILKDY